MSMENRGNIAVKSWLALLTTANAIKKDVDARLRAQFDMSISRFDVLSALDRSKRNGLRAGQLSRQLFVSDGNTTQVMSKLVKEGLVLRRPDSQDARAINYSLSDEGKHLFDRMAAAHETWIRTIFDELPDQKQTELSELLTLLKAEMVNGRELPKDEKTHA